MCKMKGGSVDLVFADPPFNIGYEYDEYNDIRSPEDYLRWCGDWIDQVWRVLKPDGTFWLAIGDEMAAELKVLCTTKPDNGHRKAFYWRSWVVWYYTFGIACSKNFARAHTHLLYFTKAKTKFTFNAKDPESRVPSARQLVYNDKRANPDGKLPDNVWVLSPLDLSKTFTETEDVWLASRVCGTFSERQDRGTYQDRRGCPQMPEEVLLRIIRACSNPYDLVLDPFGGTFTTGAAAVKLARHFVGFDISKEYCLAGRERIQAAKGESRHRRGPAPGA
jgi:site-specific DNA-methyltransferase (adenine-specific)